MTRATPGAIRIGIGGWDYAPWRGPFYPAGLAHNRELAYASRKLTSIEINGTYYRSQKPESFSRWRDETPDDFVFSLKAPRFATNRRALAEAGASIERFLASGVTELRAKLGVIVWQFMPTKAFEPADFEGFLKLLPKAVDGRTLRHALDVRHASFATPGFVALAAEYGAAIVVAADSGYPQIADPTAAFVYARIMGATEAEATGYAAADLDVWAQHVRTWAAGGVPSELRTVGDGTGAAAGRDVFLYVISGEKVRNPAAAMALLQRLQ